MGLLGNGLSDVHRQEDALVVQEAELSMLRRIGASEYNILVTQSNLAITYENLGRLDEALRLKRDVYTGFLKLFGEEHEQTLLAANNYATSLNRLERFGEAKSLLRKTVPATRRILGESNVGTLRVRSVYAEALYRDERRHIRRSPRGSDDARGDRTDRAARVWWRASAHKGD